MTACIDVRPHLAEAALGLLEGVERAATLAHIDTCDECRALVDELTHVTDVLILAAPSAEPSAGFERRVVQRLGPRRPATRTLIGAAAAAIVLVLAGFAVGRSLGEKGADVRSVAMRTPAGRTVGEAYVHGGSPSWVFVAVPDWRGDHDYQLRIDYADGRRVEIAGDGVWSTALNDSTSVRHLALVDSSGRAWCETDV